jgi:HEAT repeat protein
VTPADTLTVGPFPLADRGFLVLFVFIALVTAIALGFSVASLVLRGRNNRVARQWAALEDRWDPVMLDVLAGAAEPASLHALVRRPQHGRFIDYLLRYGRRIRGPERAVLSALAGPYLYAVSGDLGHRSVERRARAVQSVGELGAGTYRAELLAALDDAAPLVVMIAAVALSREYHAGDVHRVIGSVTRLDLLTNRLLVSMLQRLGPEAAWAFREVLRDRARPAKLRTVAAKVLAALNDQDAGPIAVSVLEDTDDVDLRVGSLQILQRIGSAEHLAVARRLADDPVAAVRGAAMRILSQAGEEQDLDRLVRALEDPVAWVAIHAAEGLRRSGRPQLLERLREAEQRRSSIVVREILFRDGAA